MGSHWDPRRAAEEQHVSSAEVVRKFGRWQDRAATRPVFVTHHGRRRLVLLSFDQYEALAGGGVRDEDDAAELMTLIDQIAQGFAAFDAELRFIHANPVACAYLRTTRAALIGRPLDEDASDLGRSVARSHIARTAATGEVSAFDAPSLAYPGAWLHIQTFPFGDGVGCLFRNISGEMETRRLAHARGAVLDAMAAEGTIGHGRLSPRGAFAEVDPTFASLAGFRPESLIRVRLTDILPIGRRVAAGEAIEAVLSGGPPHAFDSALLVNNGGELPVRIALAELHGDHGGEGAIVIVTVR